MSQNKKILILGRRDDREDYDTSDRLITNLDGHQHDVIYESCFLEELAYIFDGQNLSITNTRTNQDIEQYDGVFLLGWFKLRRHEDVAHSVALYMRAKGKKILNSEAIHTRSRTKLSQYVACALNGISQAHFIFIDDADKLAELVQKLGVEYPLIVKSITANRGNDNFLVSDEKSLTDTLESSDKALIVQGYIPNNGDYRVIVMGDHVPLIIHRKSTSNSHLHNTSKGAEATLVELGALPAKMLQDCIAISKLIGREITGVDMIIDENTGQHYLLEINNIPQLSTGSFIEEKAKALNHFFEQWIN